MPALSPIDCDLHPTVPALSALFMMPEAQRRQVFLENAKSVFGIT